MPTNRLKLDFSLSYRDERKAFLDTYLLQPQFIKSPPNADECETMANYLLWGKDRTSGLNAKQDGSVQLSSKYGDWDSDTQRTESLDALLEQPTFNENSLSDMSTPSVYIKKETFSREDALARCPEELQQTFRDLFQRIDYIDLLINYYDLLHNKRINPPREALLRKFAPEEQSEMQEKITHWNQFVYLKYRHELIELRRRQYLLRDSFAPQIVTQGYTPIAPAPIAPDWDAGIEVLPLGILGKNMAARLIYQDFANLVPQNFTEEKLRLIYGVYWQKKEFVPSYQQQYFDFRELEHVYQLFQLYYELDINEDEEEVLFDQNTGGLMRALKYYIRMADLSDLQQDILEMKLKKKRNSDISYEINHKWNKGYTDNYISTIFRQRIIPKINDAARYHEKIIENLCFPEEWKTCSCCGKTMLKDPVNFTRKSRSKDGFTARCKVCEKAARKKGD